MVEASAIGFVAVTSCFVYWSVLPVPPQQRNGNSNSLMSHLMGSQSKLDKSSR